MKNLFVRLAIRAALLGGSIAMVRAAEVTVHWLETPTVATGVSFGVPWPRGTVKKEQRFALKTADGELLPTQTWPLAYWPDGSLKWSGVATTAAAGTAGQF